MTNPDQNFVLAFNDAAAQLRRLKIRFGNEGDGFATFFAVNGKLFRLRLTEVECGDEPDVFMATEPAVAKAIAEMDAKECTCHSRDSSQLCEKCISDQKAVDHITAVREAEEKQDRNKVYRWGGCCYSHGVDQHLVAPVHFRGEVSARYEHVFPVHDDQVLLGEWVGVLFDPGAKE
jgi:hypothetical protein